LEKYTEKFKKEGITIDVMSEITVKTMKEVLGIPLGDGAKIIKAVKELDQ